MLDQFWTRHYSILMHTQSGSKCTHCPVLYIISSHWKLQVTFVTQGLPETLLLNCPGFLSKQSEEFMQQNGIKHFTIAPYHLLSNGLAERAVQYLCALCGSLQPFLPRAVVALPLSHHRECSHLLCSACLWFVWPALQYWLVNLG